MSTTAAKNITTLTTTTAVAKKTTKTASTSTVTMEKTSSRTILLFLVYLNSLCIETSPIPLPKSLSEKIDYQIYQTRVLTGIAEDNRLALKRLISMMSYLLDHDANIITNHTHDDRKQHIQNMRHANQGSLVLFHFVIIFL
jgi:hypothetical protein